MWGRRSPGSRRRSRQIVLAPEVPAQEGLIDGTLDVERCSNTGCGALLPISDRPERCPVCGRA